MRDSFIQAMGGLQPRSFAKIAPLFACHRAYACGRSLTGLSLHGYTLWRASSEYLPDWCDISSAEKNGYEHFMLKEIHEQPNALNDTLRPRLVAENGVPVDYYIKEYAAL